MNYTPTQSELDDAAEAAQERRRLREHPISPGLTECHISPVLTPEQYDDQKYYDRKNKKKGKRGRYQTPEMGKNEIEPNVIYRHGKQIKFLLLPSAISDDAYSKAERALTGLKESEWQGSSRKAAEGQKAKKFSLGWLPQIGGRSIGHDYYNLRSAPTLRLPELYISLRPLLREMDDLLHDKLPAYYDYAQRMAMGVEQSEDDDEIDLDELVKDPRHLSYLKHMEPFDMFYTIGPTIFTTVEVNGPTIFRAHEDANNMFGTCVCITALGDFVGGRLVFPRYGYSAELRPRDLLICDNNKELHGNLGPLVGERFSVVAFQHESLLFKRKVMKRPTAPATG